MQISLRLSISNYMKYISSIVYMKYTQLMIQIFQMHHRLENTFSDDRLNKNIRSGINKFMNRIQKFRSIFS